MRDLCPAVLRFLAPMHGGRHAGDRRSHDSARGAWVGFRRPVAAGANLRGRVETAPRIGRRPSRGTAAPGDRREARVEAPGAPAAAVRRSGRPGGSDRAALCRGQRRDHDVRGQPAQDRRPSGRLRGLRGRLARGDPRDPSGPRVDDPRLEQRGRYRDDRPHRLREDRQGAHRSAVRALRSRVRRRSLGGQAVRQEGPPRRRSDRRHLARGQRHSGLPLLLSAGYRPGDQRRALTPHARRSLAAGHQPQVRQHAAHAGSAGAPVPQVGLLAALAQRLDPGLGNGLAPLHPGRDGRERVWRDGPAPTRGRRRQRLGAAAAPVAAQD